MSGLFSMSRMSFVFFLLMITGVMSNSCKTNEGPQSPRAGRGKTKEALEKSDGMDGKDSSRSTQNDDSGYTVTHSDSSNNDRGDGSHVNDAEAESGKGVLHEWYVSYKKAVTKLHPSIEECSEKNPKDPTKPYRCACEIMCRAVFPIPPGGGAIKLSYPLHGVEGFKFEIKKNGRASSCSYRQTGVGNIKLDIDCSEVRNN